MTAWTAQELIDRAGLHSSPTELLRPAQRFQGAITDEDVARVMHAVESGVDVRLNRAKRWTAPPGVMPRPAVKFSLAVTEAIRTGLLRFWADRHGIYLIPAPVHLMHPGPVSACHFTGETMGPIRSRLAVMRALVDCRDCLEIIKGESHAL